MFIHLLFIYIFNLIYQLLIISDIQNFLSTKQELKRNNAIKYTFDRFNIYVPNWPSGGPLLIMNLGYLSKMNFTNNDISETQFKLAKLMLEMYEQLNITNDNFHQGTSSNVAVIDDDDIYVSLIT